MYKNTNISMKNIFKDQKFFLYSLGATIIEMMASIAIIQMVVHVIQTALVMIVMFCVFNNPFAGSVITLSSLMIITGISGMFFGE